MGIKPGTSRTNIATSKNPWDDGIDRPSTEFLNEHQPIPEDDGLEQRKPRNLKPLRRKSKSGEEQRQKPKFRNIAEEYLNHRKEEKAEIHHENAREMKKLNDDMDELFQYAKPGTSIIDEMNHAFEGRPD